MNSTVMGDRVNSTVMGDRVDSTVMMGDRVNSTVTGDKVNSIKFCERQESLQWGSRDRRLVFLGIPPSIKLTTLPQPFLFFSSFFFPVLHSSETTG